ncbi:iron ABC transporter substrate-binding protein [Mannheimia granulomatis]|uniref:Iron ABC transporter substrate-binding protein n=1 Tax=Mannheimia granulomatis TaxID=85402 RepID=A0A6G8JJ71_9PAST|nr:ABC transporter substrate-binding protein [Mannheimia granulomatis]QIM67074.1 iron ABC transporter substrate-binding protein [Mannheimia granulomatis]
MIKHLFKRLFFLFILQISTVFAQTKIFTPDWSIASALTEMGNPPIAMGDKRIYPLWSHRPIQPDSVLDIGTRYQPNRELLAQLPVDLVLSNFFYAHLSSVYSKEIRQIDVLFDGGNLEHIQSWHTYQKATRVIGEAIKNPQAAEAYLTHTENQLAIWGIDIRKNAPEIDHYAVVQFGSPKELRLYASNSMFHVAFDLMGLKQADLGVGDRWGNKLITVSELAKLPERTCLIIISPFSKMTQADLAKSYIWQRLGFGKSRCMKVLPPVWLFGGPDSISHFAEFLHYAMTQPDNQLATKEKK